MNKYQKNKNAKKPQQSIEALHQHLFGKLEQL
jgi:hypothetical protein